VQLPGALRRNEQTGEQGRHHLDPSLVQKTIRRAVIEAKISKTATSHSFRHSFATHLLERDHDIRTTMIYTHVLNRGPFGISSPADTLKLGRGANCQARLAKRDNHA
jgi:integrase